MQKRIPSERKAPEVSRQRLGVLRSFRLRSAPQRREGAKAAAAFVTFGDSESARKLPQSKTWRRFERLMDSFLHPLAVRGTGSFRKAAERWRQNLGAVFCPIF